MPTSVLIENSLVLSPMRARLGLTSRRARGLPPDLPEPQPGSTDSRGASRPLSRPEASPPGFALAPPLADRPGSEGVTLRMPGRSTMDGAHDHESSTIDRWI